MTQGKLEFIGKAIIISAPSGSGKTTIAKNLLASNTNLQFSISACTRNRREESEKDGVDYYFISKEHFQDKISEDKFVEWEEVYKGIYYGTLKSEVERIWSNGKHILFDVDVKGGLKLKKYFGDRALAIFIKAPSLEEIKKRLSARKTESTENQQMRLEKIEYELSFENDFDVTVTNESLETAKEESRKLVETFLSK